MSGTHRQPVIAANWKMNLGPTAAAEFVERFQTLSPDNTAGTMILFPPALSLAAVRAAIGDISDIRLGVQNVHTEETGAFTGENSAPMARDAGATFVLVGHSERRHVFGETNAETAAKCRVVVGNALTPVLCVGETITQREAGETNAVVLGQLQEGLAGLRPEQIVALVIAYEPVWAIGTGRTATPRDAATVHVLIRGVLVELAGEGGREIPILYGGSVTPENAQALLAAEEVGGLLVGGASLDPDRWASICAAAGAASR